MFPDSRHPTSGRRHPLREVARSALRICAAAALATAGAAAQEDALSRMVSADAARFLNHPEPRVRGEAALIVAAQRNPVYHEAVLRVARDPEPAARLRGLIALGLQATPGVAVVLDEALADQSRRTDDAGLCAAFAFGSLPPDHAPAPVARTLTSFLTGNWHRQSSVLQALLAGMRRHEQRLQVTALQSLRAERSNRDEGLRCAIFELLLPVDPDWTRERTLKALTDANDAERVVLLHWLADNTTPYDAELASPIERLAAHAGDSATRAAALAVLTRLRHPPAIEIAVRALRSASSEEIEQGMRSALAIGGSAMRLALERHVRDSTDPKAVAAMLRAWAAPLSTALADFCADRAQDRTTPVETRIAAATLLARGEPVRASPMLRDLFRCAADRDPRNLLAIALARGAEAPLSLDRLLPDPPDPALHPAHWQALLAAGHPEANRAMLALLESPSPDPERLVNGLAAWRRALVLGPAHLAATALPASLRSILLD